MSEELGREPTDEELSEEIGISSAKLSQLKTVSIRPASLDAPISDDDSTERCFDADPINNTLASFPAANLVCQQQISMLGLPAQFDRIFRVMHNWLKRHRLAVLAPFAAHRRFDQP
jgi:hypothetical protein